MIASCLQQQLSINRNLISDSQCEMNGDLLINNRNYITMGQKKQGEYKILFQDKDVLVNQNEVQIKWYYFPTTGTKTIPFSRITNIEYGELDILSGGARLWGMSVLRWGYWFAGDADRMDRDHFIAIHTDSIVKKAFTTANHKVVYKLINELWKKWKENHPNEVSQEEKSSDQAELMVQNSEKNGEHHEH